jgi:hypothetical protein
MIIQDESQLNDAVDAAMPTLRTRVCMFNADGRAF